MTGGADWMRIIDAAYTLADDIYMGTGRRPSAFLFPDDVMPDAASYNDIPIRRGCGITPQLVYDVLVPA
jgi:hypothetical protein